MQHWLRRFVVRRGLDGSAFHVTEFITGERIQRKLNGGSVRVHNYYRCANNYPESDHPSVRWRADDLEDAIIADLSALKMPDEEVVGWFRASLQTAFADISDLQRNRRAAMTKRRSELATMNDRLLNAFLAGSIYVCRDVEGPVVYDCDGDGYPFLPVAATAPRAGERVWSCGYPHLNGRRELRWAKGAMLRWSTFEYAGGSFNGNVVAFVTAPGWSGGPLLNAKGEVCGLLNSTDCATSVFISSAAVRQAYAAVRPSHAADSPPRSGKPTLYVFGSMTCGPCRQFKNDYANHAQLRQTLDAAFTVEFVDVNKQVDLASRFGVAEVPTFLVPGGARVTGYEGPDQLLAALGLREQITAQPPPQRDVADDTPAQAEPVVTPAPSAETDAQTPPAPNPTESATASPSAIDERLDRLNGLVQTAVSIATWLGVGGATGGAGGLILGGLALWRTLRRRRESRAARDPPSVPTAPIAAPPVITVDTPPPPQAIVPETRFAPYERDTFAEAFAWAEVEMARKYPGAVSTLETLKGLISQFLSAKGIKPAK